MAPPRWRTLTWRHEGRPFVLDQCFQLEFILEKMATRAGKNGALMLELFVPRHGYMRIGIGPKLGMLSYRPEKPSKTKKNKVSRGIYLPGDSVYFDYRGLPQGYAPHRLIPNELAFIGLLEFFKAGSLDPRITWDDWST